MILRPSIINTHLYGSILEIKNGYSQIFLLGFCLKHESHFLFLSIPEEKNVSINISLNIHICGKTFIFVRRINLKNLYFREEHG